jgi:hypothetical protein
MSTDYERKIADRATELLRADRISGAQVSSYVKFLGPDPTAHLIFRLLDALNIEPRDFARDGIRWTEPHGELIDDVYLALWDPWAAAQTPPPPTSHCWVKGVVATGIALTEEQPVRA